MAIGGSNNWLDEDRMATVFSPVLDILFDELDALGLPCATAREAGDSLQFTRLYLEAVQALEAYVARDDSHAPMQRGEVEMMCRCALSAPDLERAMELVVAFAAMLYPRAGQLALERGDTGVRFVHNSLRGKPSLASSLADITGIFAFKQLFQWLTGGRVAPRLVSIGHLRRDDILPFLHLFSTPVIAEGSVYYLEYALADLQHPVVASPGAFEAFFEYFPCAVYAPGEMPLANQVSSLLSAAMRQAVPMPALVQVAAQLGVPASTLRLKLEQSGTSYRALRNQCQYEAALVLLADSALSIGDIADQLGFKNPATFRRAFRRWSGAPPSRFRAGGATGQGHSGADAAI